MDIIDYLSEARDSFHARVALHTTDSVIVYITCGFSPDLRLYILQGLRRILARMYVLHISSGCFDPCDSRPLCSWFQMSRRAEAGRCAAVAAGASNSMNIFHVTMIVDGHHFSDESLADARNWLLQETTPTPKFVEFSSVYTEEPSSGNYTATLIFLQGMSDRATDQLVPVRERRFFETLGDRIRLVAPVISSTSLNPVRQWFPFVVNPWDPISQPKSFGDRAHLNQAVSTLYRLFEVEANRYGGDSSKIFVLGHSMGGMIASYFALTTNLALGCVIMHASAFPYLEIESLTDTGKAVTIRHYHDPNDVVVQNNFAEAGRNAAVAAGASNYINIFHVTMNYGGHQWSDESVADARNWLLQQIQP